ncbi:hypothetical protein [Streptomyces sp. SAI-126]|uniref:hypothetical protein n=1 Tax=Streptomyces sp. SAI-126 TaxID=3377732 RepID=UPI003C79AE21
MDSLNSARQWVEFQLLKPMGGVRARPSARAGEPVPASSATAGAPGTANSSTVSAATILRRVVRV